MGGDTYTPSSSEEESLLGHESINSSVSSDDDDEGLSQNLANGSVTNEDSGVNFREFRDVGPGISSIGEAAERQRQKVYAEVSMSYQDWQHRIDWLKDYKDEILSYHPGSWTEKAGGMDLKDYVVPNITSLLLIGPKGSGKSSLVNKISQVLENHAFLPGRAQVSHNSSTGDGTYFLHEYIIPREAGSFCLYDTRSLSVDSSENQQMFDHWMMKGVRHGVLIERKSDSTDLKAKLKYKDRRNCSSSQFRGVDFVIFVVNALSVLESMDSDDKNKKQYSQVIATNFKNPLLSFKNDKPVVVVTHGDLLSLSDRVRVRVYLGDLLGVPPATQIFDIPDDNDPSTILAIFDLLCYSLDRADQNLPTNGPSSDKVDVFVVLLLCMLLVLFFIIFGSFRADRFVRPTPPPPTMKIEWHKIRHLWLG